MRESDYPVTLAKSHEKRSSKSHIGSPFDTPQRDAGSTPYVKHSGTGVEDRLRSGGGTSATQNRDARSIFCYNDALQSLYEKLRSCIKDLFSMNDILQAHVDEINVAYDNTKAERTRSVETYKDIISEIVSAYANGQGLNPNALTGEDVQAAWETICSDAEASKHLRAQLEDLGTQTETLRRDLKASRLQCEELRERQWNQDAELKHSFQHLELFQDEARGLRIQIQALQKEMLAQVSSNEVISDELFSRDFRALASMVKSLSRSVQPAQDMDILGALEPCVLLHSVPKHHWDTRARKKAYVEAWIWSMLIVAVFQYSFGFCEDFLSLHENWRFIFGGSWMNHWPKPTSECEIWRFTTVKKLVGDIGRETLVTSQDPGYYPRPNAHAHHLQKQVLERKTFIAKVIGSHLTTVAPMSDLSCLPDIVNKAFELALNMSMQRSRIQVTWPSIGERFEDNYMTPVPDRSGEDIHVGVVASIVNPGLTRWGNTHGQNFDICHKIMPSLVQLEPVQTRQAASHVLKEVKQEPERI